MEFRSSADTVFIFLYITGALLLIVTSVSLYTRKFRRNKLQAVNHLELITSIENTFYQKTQFLVITPVERKVELNLLDQDEKFIRTLASGTFSVGEHAVDFDPAELKEGKYYLSLTSDDAKIIRRIEVTRVPHKQGNEV